ncbi:MAG: prepilin-type N-terminal cleavage/methylation domain-containing protein, partial [Patescibacteria group bacterium]
MNDTKNNQRNGFTLIELLVVIAIIGIIGTIMLVSLQSARKKARDSRRKTDINSIVLALQLYNFDTNSFPPYADTQSGDWPVSYKVSLAPYAASLPKDPLANNTTHFYSSF